MRLQGKSYKDIKEAFIDLRASYQYTQKQLEIARASRDDNSKLVSKLTKRVQNLEARILKSSEQFSSKLKETNTLHKKEVSDLTKEISNLLQKISAHDSKVADLRSKIVSANHGKHSRKARIVKLTEQLRESSDALKKAESQVVRLSARLEEKPKYRIRKVREKVIVPKVVKEPLPDKIRQLLSNNTITQSKMDILLVSAELLNFSDKTRLTLRQMVLLLEANNLGYFTSKQLLYPSAFTIKELEYKQLVSGDRSNTKRAIGWFITKRGKRVAEMLLKKIYNSNLKRQYLKNED